MKLRNSLFAVATATALVSGGVAAPAHAEERGTTPPATETGSSIVELFQGSSNSESEEEDTDSGSSDSDLTKAKNWIGVVTAIIGLLGTVITFASKNLGLTLPKLG
ncbi:hypothetical protein [Corynebacterium sanguinis]|uniref:Secreted protein n=1 Tax=Corynebacterium sanguinis TaxID=2594913 RepID=A0A6I7R610_9CORY|nr:hypothetical protein [Corynebacterium sanguinis]MBA4504064.1 hypothetical protein [Corynebacterium sanguinis]MCT1498227.1 hypothetical protein [Corynebacterium sanguinis]MCT1805074.1 hypothetical protein [Corynebacterium sanguinis]MCT2153348.1 hypothetical protein [Corynebacterium sanguinis]MCT2158179.1 hypothetical protein [Corynebacterium sanguinis]